MRLWTMILAGASIATPLTGTRSDRIRRYPVFIARVEAGISTPEAQLDAAVQNLLRNSGMPVSVTRAGGYLIYQPSGPVAFP